MKKILAMIMATSMLTSMAVAADYIPGDDIEFTGAADENWEWEYEDAMKAINSDNYSLSTIKWEEGKALVASVKIDDEEDKLVISLKHDYKSTKEKNLEGSVKLREKGKSRYATLNVKGTVGYKVEELTINDDNEIDDFTVDSGSIYKIVGKNKGYGNLTFTAGEADVSVRVYDGEIYYLDHTDTPNKNVLVANTDSDATIDFMNFEGTPTFNSTATISFYGVEKEHHIYEIKDGKLVKSAAKWNDESDVWELKTRTLGSYVISDKALKSPSGSGSGSGSSNSTTDPEDNNEKNPDTGANDVVGVASALALVALASAAAVSLKKQK